MQGLHSEQFTQVMLHCPQHNIIKWSQLKDLRDKTKEDAVKADGQHSANDKKVFKWKR